MSDESIDGKYRGWADRTADVMAREVDGFTYCNLAVRGKLVKQVAEDQVPVALTFVTGPETLVSFHAGINDAMRPNYRPELVLPLYQGAVRTIAASGATVLLFTVLEKTGNTGKVSEVWAERFSAFNEAVHEVGLQVGAIVVDVNEDHLLSNRGFLAFDRLHLNSIGHDRCAQSVLEKLGLGFNPAWRTPLPPSLPTPWLKKQTTGALWLIIFLLPWIWRRLRGKSSGDGRVCKYPTPVKWGAYA